ncbi:MAG: PAS domain-containing protein [Coriobacteriia bacterium]
MLDETAKDWLLDSLKEPIVFCDTDHVIRYMNAAAKERYKSRPAAIGQSIFDCHKEASNDVIRHVIERLAQGEDEVRISESERQRTYMRAVRDGEGRLVGYYERFEFRG